MKQIFITLLLSVCLPSISKAVPMEMHWINVIRLVAVDSDVLDGLGKGKRTSAFVPITATHSADNLYLESSISLEEVAVTVKDEWGYVVYEAITPLFADEQAAFPLNLNEGCYTLEIKYGSICLLGDFEI